MLRKLLIITCLLTATKAYTQEDLVPMFVPSTTPQNLPEDSDKANYTNMGSPLPYFRAVTIPAGSVRRVNGADLKKVEVPAKSITPNDVKNNANLLVMIFNPTCGHCEDQTDTLAKYIYLFKKSHLVMITGANMGPYLEQFEKDHHTLQYPTMQIGLDSANFVRKVFLYSNLPQINIYNKERKLIKTFNGGTLIDSLKKYIQ